MNVFLTGGTGYIGSRLISALQARGQVFHLLGFRGVRKTPQAHLRWD